MKPSPFYVYAYFRLDGTPCYVGKGKGERWHHRGATGRNKHFLSIRAQAKALGLDLPCVKLAEGLTEDQALQIERDLILLVGREALGGPLVNLTDGGDGRSGYRYTDAQRRAHGDIRRGRKHSPEWRAAISAAMKGKQKSASHIENAAAALRGTTKASGWWSSAEGRAKQRANNPGHSGFQHSAEAIRIIKFARMRQDARTKVTTSSTWAARNSIRHQQAA